MSCFTICIALICAAQATAAEIDFDARVAPILASRCLDCHSTAEKKGGLDLSHAKSAMAGGDSGKALEVGNVDDSLLWQRILADEMPPKKPLSAAERETLQEWIAAGAKWGTDPIDPYRFTTASRAGYDWWSLRPLVRPSFPTIEGEKWGNGPIDAFVYEKLAAQGLKPSAPADRRTLIRRLSFDLIGLPPSLEDIERFKNDDSPEAYKRLVDRLLDSPHYGERWARHWLDIVHFGESDGFEYDRMRPNAWRYRDWVIETLNRDLPFDEFARLQIAGDVLRKNDPAAIIATGFLVAGAHDSLLPKGDAMRQIMRQDELEDVVAIVSQTFLGLTVNCARCHDHKFDPIPQVDYYRLTAALAGVRRGERALPAAKIPAELIERRKIAEQALTRLEQSVRTAVMAEREAKRKAVAPPEPLASWDFTVDFRDQSGAELHGTPHGGAKIENGRLQLDGKGAYVATVPLKRDLTAKTLVATVQLADLKQRGGGVMSLQTLDGREFDAIVFGERDPGQWLAGSNNFKRTNPFDGPAETTANKKSIQIAIVYYANGRIVGYRDGEPYGNEYRADNVQTFQAGDSQIVFGLRHSPPGGNKLLAGTIERASLFDRALSAAEVAATANVVSSFISDDELAARLDADQQQTRGELLSEIKSLQDQITALTSAKTFAITPQQPDTSHLLLRGNPQTKGEVVAAGALSAAKPLPVDFGLAADAPEAERRIKLAQWITNEQNPLFARTIVNRIWHYHFGRGLVETPNDLGYSGGEPSHPKLLDWLATELIAKSWSLKQLHREIVMSATYQQASLPRAEAIAIDADNRLLWRYSPYRLEAESIRDAMLSIAGELNPEVGGPPYQDFRPYISKNAQFYEPADPVGKEFARRSIYRTWARGGKNPLLDTFDCPDPSTATPRRGSTTTPLQALTLLNNSFTLRMADAFAERLAREAPGDIRRQVSRGLELVTGKPASYEQLAATVTFVEWHGLAAFCRVLLNTNGFLYVD